MALTSGRASTGGRGEAIFPIVMTALLVVQVFAGAVQSSASDAPDPEIEPSPHGSSATEASSSETTRSPTAGLGSSTALDLPRDVTGREILRRSHQPVDSVAVDATLPPKALAKRYVTEARALEHPLQDALRTWNDAIDSRSDRALIDDPAFHRADELPRRGQVVTAAMLYALTDATHLQNQALDGLDEDSLRSLLSSSSELVVAGGSAGPPAERSKAAKRIAEAGGGIDTAKIRQAGAIVAATTEEVQPVLDEWGDDLEDEPDRTRAVRDSLRRLEATYAPDRLDRMDRLERLQVLVDAIRLAAKQGDGKPLPEVSPIEPDEEEPLVSAIRKLAELPDTSVSETLLDRQAAQAKMLPLGLRRALGRIVENHAAWLDAVRSPDSASLSPLAAQLRTVKAVQTSAPTLEAYRLVFEKSRMAGHPGPGLQTAGTASRMAGMAEGMDRTAPSPDAAVYAAGRLRGDEAVDRPAPPLPERGALAEAVLRLYDRQGVNASSAVRDRVREGVQHLPPDVERNAARVVRAQLDALDRLQEFYGSLSPSTVRALRDASSPEVLHGRLQNGSFGREDLESLRAYVEVADRAQDTYQNASIEVAAAMRAAREDLKDRDEAPASTETVGPVAAEDGDGWTGGLADALARLSPFGAASAQPVDGPSTKPTCWEAGGAQNRTSDGADRAKEEARDVPKPRPLPPTDVAYPRVTDCRNDVLFMDPLLRTVVISGTGETTYASHLGMRSRLSPGGTTAPVRGQMMSLDLGGDDTYYNNAGGALLSTTVRGRIGGGVFFRGINIPGVAIFSPTTTIDPTATATALDLGGDDAYRRPSEFAHGRNLTYLDVIVPNTPITTGAFSLINASKTDTHLADPEPAVVQGAAAGGIGMLWDVDGDDSYRAGKFSQGYGGGFLDQSRADMPCRRDGPRRVDLLLAVGAQAETDLCVPGLTGVGILLDDQGRDRYQAGAASQGASGRIRGIHDTTSSRARVDVVVGTVEGIDPVSENVSRVDRLSIPSGAGVLWDVSGNDKYSLDDSQDPTRGQGAGDNGLGMLVDSGGDDRYRSGWQGQGRRAGLGGLVDLAGEDRYTRTRQDNGLRYSDGQCRTTFHDDNATDLALPGLGVLVDLKAGGGCSYDVEQTLADLPDPQGPVDRTLRRIEQARHEVEREAEEAIRDIDCPPRDAPEQATRDRDGDGWPDCIETYGGLSPFENYTWDPDDPTDSPTPAAGGGTYLVEIPGILVIGDTGSTTYPGISSPQGRHGRGGHEGDGDRGGVQGAGPVNDLVPSGADHLVTLDLGGDDEYQNGVGGRLQLAVDVAGDDVYENGRRDCLQGCDGTLLDLGGADTYDVGDRWFAQGASRYLSGIAFDAAGDDEYVAGDWSQGALAHGDTHLQPGHRDDASLVGSMDHMPGPRIGLLVDPDGTDRYRARSQAKAFAEGTLSADSALPLSGPCTREATPGSATAGGAFFLELAGADRYQPVGGQGQAVGELRVMPSCIGEALTRGSLTVTAPYAPRTAAFLDADGWDTYRGSWTPESDVPRTEARNGRARLRAATADRIEAFVDRNRTSPGDGSAPPEEGDRPLDMPALGVAVGTEDQDIYHRDYALVTDPGGDDVYENNAGATLLPVTSAAQPTTHTFPGTALTGNPRATTGARYGVSADGPVTLAAAVLDDAGDDVYAHDALGRPFDHVGPEPDDPPPTGTAPDAIGRADTYAPSNDRRSGFLAQGAGFLGVGLLFDRKGDDTYRARGLAQGASLLGAGVLWDRRGDDRYTVDPRVVRNPQIQGEFVAYETVVDGVWRPVVVGPNRECRALVGPDHPGPVRDLRLEQLPDQLGVRALYSALNARGGRPTWAAYEAAYIPGAGGCGDDTVLGPDELADPTLPERPQADQLHPVHAPDAPGTRPYLLQDNRNGDWDIVRTEGPGDLTDDFDDTVAVGGRDKPVVAVDGSDQVHPHVDGSTLVWQDDRQGDWAIWTATIGADDAQPISPDGGVHVDPDLSASFVVWQTRSDATTGWDIAVYDRFAETQPLRILDCPGDQTDPTVAGATVLFTDDGTEVARYDAGGDAEDPCGAVETVAVGAQEPDVDPTAPTEHVWIDTDGTDPDGAPNDPNAPAFARSPFWEVTERTPEGDRDRVTRAWTSARGSLGRLLQGSAWQPGLGLLVDEEGLDRYQGWDWSQGASFSLAALPGYSPEAHRNQVRQNPDQAAHGVLADLSGNDVYRADTRSQGVHWGGFFSANQNGVAFAEVDENLGTLLDLRGADRYEARGLSQGLAGLTIAETHRHIAPMHSEPAPGAYLPASAGLFQDLGGNDTYRYGGDVEALTEASVPSCREVRGRVFDRMLRPIEFALNQTDNDPSPLERTPWQWLGFACDQVNGVLDEVQNTTSPVDNATRSLRERAENETGTDDLGQSRNDQVWIQEPDARGDYRRARREGGDTFQSNSEVVGGVGVDVGATDAMARQLRRIGDDLLDLRLQAYNPDGSQATGRLGGSVALASRVEARSEGLEVKRVEFYIDGRFVGYGDDRVLSSDTPCKGQQNRTWCVPWHTTRTPDDAYRIHARAYYGLEGAGGPISFVENATVFEVDNVPRFTESVVTPRFSPEPYRADDEPGQLTASVGLSQDPWIEEDQGQEGDAWFRVEVRNASGAVAEPHPYALVNASEPPAPTWDGTHAGDPVPSGTYEVVFEATDRAPTGSDDKDRTVSRQETAVVDAQPPTEGCVRTNWSLAQACNPTVPVTTDQSGVHPIPNEPKAKVDLVLATDEPRPERVHVFVRHGDDGWTKATEIPTSKQEVSWTLPEVTSGRRTRVLVLWEDATGNLECEPACGDIPSEALSAVDPSKSMTDVVDQKVQSLGDGAFLTLVPDLQPPILFSPDQDMVYRIDGELRPKGDAFYRVGPSTDVELRYRVKEQDTTPVGHVRWSGAGETWTDTFKPACRGSGGYGCPSGDYDLVWNDWTEMQSQLPDDLEGQIFWRVRATDAVGNPTDKATGSLVFDPEPPTVEKARVEYPGGQIGINETGQVATVWVRAEDPKIPDGELAPNDAIDVRLDTSTVSQTPEVTLTHTEGGTPSCPPDSFCGAVAVDNVTIPEKPRTIDLPLELTDEAGNTNADVRIPLIVGDPDIEVVDQQREVGLHEATLDLGTNVPGNVTVTYGPAGSGFGSTAEATSSPNGTEHGVELTGLEAATAYRYRVRVTTDVAGKVFGPFRLATHAGLSATIDEPSSGTILAGVETLATDVSVSSADGAEVEVAVRAANDSLRGGSRLLAEEIVEEGRFTSDLVTGALPDGVYELVVNVTYESPVRVERTQEKATGLVVDNSPPELGLRFPRPNATLPRAPDRLELSVHDALTDVEPGTAIVRVNGEPIDPVSATIDGSTMTIDLDPDTSLPKGALRWTVTVRDEAGNAGVLTFSNRLDPDAPSAELDVDSPVRVVYPADQSAAAPGDVIRLVVPLSDASDIDRVVADATPLGGPESLRLQPGPEGYHGAVRVAEAAATGTVPVNVTAEDAVGHVASLTATVRVDGTPPRLVDWTTTPRNVSAGYAAARFDEPVDGTVTLREDGRTLGRFAPLAGDRARRAADVLGIGSPSPRWVIVEVPGLEVGTTYGLEVAVSDAAGLGGTHDRTWRFEPTVADPSTPQGLSAEVTPDRRIRLDWSVDRDGPGIRYDVFRGIPGTGSPQLVATTAETSYLDRSARPGIAYEYFVQSRNLQGRTGPATGIASAKIEAPVDASGFEVRPSEGTATTPFTFRFDLRDASSRAPAAWLVLDASPTPMHRVDAADCRQRCTFAATATLPALDLETPSYRYHVEVADGDRMHRFPADGGIPGPTVVTDPDPTVGGRQAVPTLGFAGFVAALMLATVLVTVRRDRR